ncbi:hypothetical protein BGZ58_003054 [Dissophora ornata]|nr:hypothetical protein BGZ58_003054 [Dissophora ornata]
MFENLDQFSRVNFESPPQSPNKLDPKVSAPTTIAAAIAPTTPVSPTSTATVAAEVAVTAESTTIVADSIHPLSVSTPSEQDTVPFRDAAPLELPSNFPTEAPEPTETAASANDTSIASPPAAAEAEDAAECSNALLRPTKSALKRQRTRNQVFEELRAFTRSPQYVALAKSLAISFESSSTLNYTEGSRSEPISPVASGLGPTFLLPIFPSPTKYHFRSHDRRRASFPKSASQSNRLNVNVNVNMSVNMQLNGSSIRSDASSTGSNIKQLRFSLEVQELVFLPTSPPFRISRAKPTRAHSDPAIQTSTCSSFIAPSHVHAGVPQSIYPGQSLISTAAASASSFENTTTTFIKVRAQGPSRRSSAKTSSTAPYLHHDDDDEDDAECHFIDDFQEEYHFEDCHESDYDDEDDDEFNGMISGGSHRLRLSAKDAIIARRAQTDENRRHPGVLWQVYTAVTGVRELIAWYGSMVYHSSSL